MTHDKPADEVDTLRAELEVMKVKSEGLCNQNGDLMIKLAAAQAEVERLSGSGVFDHGKSCCSRGGHDTCDCGFAELLQEQKP